MNQKQKKIILYIMIISVAALFICEGILLYFINRTKTYKTQITLGDKYLSEMQYEDAEICFLKALDINERKINPYFYLVDTYTRMNDSENAYLYLEKAKEINRLYYANRITETIEWWSQYVVMSLTEKVEKDDAESSNKSAYDKMTKVETPAAVSVETKPSTEDEPLPNADKDKIRQAYRDFIAQESFNLHYYAIVDGAENGNPVLMVSTEAETTENAAMNIDFSRTVILYNYVDGQIVSLGELHRRAGYWYFDGSHIGAGDFIRDANSNPQYGILVIEGASYTREGAAFNDSCQQIVFQKIGQEIGNREQIPDAETSEVPKVMPEPTPEVTPEPTPEEPIEDIMLDGRYTYYATDAIYGIEFSNSTGDTADVYIGYWYGDGTHASVEDFMFTWYSGQTEYSEVGLRSGILYNITIVPRGDIVHVTVNSDEGYCTVDADFQREN